MRFQTIIDLSLEADKIISGFSEDVANAVTQPLWPEKLDDCQSGNIPSRTPFKIRLSAIM